MVVSVDSWREVAARVVAEEGGAPIHSEPEPCLPRAIVDGLAALAAMSPPRRLKGAEAWLDAKADAARLAAGGWAANALALGWHPLELFGVGAKGSGDFEGLAVWLTRRRPILLDERRAVALGSGRHFVFSRRTFDLSAAGGVVFLWEFGRG
jgi:hypothetical protein